MMVLCKGCKYWFRRYGDTVPYGRCEILTASLRQGLPESEINFDCQGDFGCVLGEPRDRSGQEEPPATVKIREELADLKRTLERTSDGK